MSCPTPNDGNGSEPLDPDGQLARGVFKSDQMRVAKRGTIPIEVFSEEGKQEISVDRYSEENIDQLATIGDKRAAGRAPIGKRKFYGWAILTVDEAAGEDRHVKPSRTKCNPFHADIVVPSKAMGDKAKGDDLTYNEQMLELAENSHWKARP